MKTKIRALSAVLALALSLGASAVQAASTTDNNFTMLTPTGSPLPEGANNVVATWDGLYESSGSSTNFSHMSLSTMTPFYGYIWTTHHIRVFGPGTYTIDTTCTVAQLEAGIAVCNNGLQPSQTQQFYNFTVNANQLGAHMLFDWYAFSNMDIVQVWDQAAAFGPNPMYTGWPGSNPANTVWGLMSTDWDGDGINGSALLEGGIMGYSPNFNLFSVSAVPVPGAIWLFGSGLIGLIAFARNRRIVKADIGQ